MRKAMMLALRQKLTISPTTAFLPDTSVGSYLPALPRAKPVIGTRAELLSRGARGLLAGAALFLCLSISDNTRADEVAAHKQGHWVYDTSYFGDDDDPDDDSPSCHGCAPSASDAQTESTPSLRTRASPRRCSPSAE